MKKTIGIVMTAFLFWMLPETPPDTPERLAVAPAFAQPPAGALAPAFALKDLSGKTFSLGDQKGKPVLIIFSTTWCAYCRTEIPNFKKIYDTYAKRGLVVVNIDIGEPKSRVARFAEQHKLPYRVLLDEDGRVAEAYEIRGVPSLVLMDGKGRMVCHQCRSVESYLKILFEKP